MTSDDELLGLASELVAVDTANPPGGELAAAEVVARRLRGAGTEVDVQELEPGRANLVARLAGDGRAPGLMLSGHLDTVPVDVARWTVDPHGGDVRDGRLWGRGSLDMKGSVAAMVVAFERVRASGIRLGGDLVLALTAGEEVDSVGAERLCDTPLLDGVEMAIVGEPTDLGVAVSHRGALWVRAVATGVSGHGSLPGASVNAVRVLLDWLHPFAEIEELADERDPFGVAAGVSLNVIAGGRAPNVIPDRAEAVLDFRTVRAQAHGEILAALRERPGEVELEVLRDAPLVSVEADDRLVVAALAAVAAGGRGGEVRRMPYVTDASTFSARRGIRSVIVGPGAEAGAHRDDESILVADLFRAAAVYEAIARDVLGV